MNKFEVCKVTFSTDDMGNVNNAHKQLLEIKCDNLIDYIHQDLLTELTTNLADEVIEGEVETEKDRMDHLAEFLFASENKDIYVYDGSASVQIHYVVLATFQA